MAKLSPGKICNSILQPKVPRELFPITGPHTGYAKINCADTVFVLKLLIAYWETETSKQATIK